ncbi:MAG: cyclic nucleotide-binding domain-containing protein [SAR324 cluster bacterium]|nr:cyclic nucleotide-binding domain-containing protein [SAR324 cluster bacterium]
MPEKKRSAASSKINKLEIMPGVYWVEIKEAEVRILCACPEDSVKHLMRRGIIAPTEENGVLFETGPNVILLSDILVQNGKFSNLAEFPVLQMLYRQGMILPNHPNNTGIKPTLIGSRQQVDAQMRYIYQGNYGLTCEEDIIKTGISPELAKVMMQLKLKFAFGAIRPFEELLDVCIVEQEKEEIRNKVFIKRKQLNVYEIQYGDESVSVDLNLPANTTYNPPYRLGFHNIRREYFFAVLHAGEGDGWDIHRPCMSSILMFQGKIFLIDAGPNILHSLTALGISVNEIEGIFHTHAHDDHFAGLPTLVQSDYKLKYYATPLVRKAVFRKFSALTSIDEDQLYQYFEIHDLEFDVWNDIDGLEVQPIFSPHPVETSIFIFRTLWETGYQSYAHFADIIALDVLRKMVTDDPEQPGISLQFFEKVREKYLTPASIKKIDIGGGLIHGKTQDFHEDSSEKIMLSHTSLDLTEEQKMVGSGAPFGMIDVFIHSQQNYAMRQASQYIRAYFPNAPAHLISILLNNSVKTFNPETILLKTGEIHDDIFLLLTGTVEQIQPMLGVYNILTAGSLVGDISGLHEMPSIETYRALSFVQTLRIPKNLFSDFAKKSDVYSQIDDFQDTREYLLASPVFGSLSYPVLNRIVKSMKKVHYDTDYELPDQVRADISLVTGGEIELFIENTVIDTLTVGHCFGQEGVLYQKPNSIKMRTKHETDVFQIPGDVIQEIPGVLWKLSELYEKHDRMLGNFLPKGSSKPPNSENK